MTVAVGRVYGEHVAENLSQVQAILDEHVGASAGRCALCGGPDPCRPYLMASRAFAWSGHLPRRRPGATLHNGAVPGYVRRY